MTTQSQSLKEFMESTPLDLRWVGEQSKKGVCPNCGSPFGWSSNRDCFPVITSVWCGTIGRHILRPERRVPAESPTPD